MSVAGTSRSHQPTERVYPFHHAYGISQKTRIVFVYQGFRLRSMLSGKRHSSSRLAQIPVFAKKKVAVSVCKRTAVGAESGMHSFESINLTYFITFSLV